jgi:hypothetical protein
LSKRNVAEIHPDQSCRRLPLEGVQTLLDQLIEEEFVPLDALAVQPAALLAAARRTNGSSIDLRDTLFAGIALASEVQLATRNLSHFHDTTLSLINPFAGLMEGSARRSAGTTNPQFHGCQPMGKCALSLKRFGTLSLR